MSDSTLWVYEPLPCLGGCGRIVHFPLVTCGAEGCLARYEREQAQDDKYRNMVDFDRD